MKSIYGRPGSQVIIGYLASTGTFACRNDILFEGTIGVKGNITPKVDEARIRPGKELVAKVRHPNDPFSTTTHIVTKTIETFSSVKVEEIKE